MSWNKCLPLGIPLVLCLVLNFALFFVISQRNSEYLRDYRLALNPDAPTYLALGHNIWVNHVYSRSSEPPYKLDFGWTPAFPVLAGGCECLFGVVGVFGMNTLMSALSCVGLFLLVRHFWGVKAGGIAATFMALDPLVAIYNFEAMSDVPFLFFVVWGLGLALPPLLEVGKTTRHWGALLVGGVSFGLAILTRPTGLYLPLVLLLCFAFVTLWQREHIVRRARLALIFFLVCYTLPGLWMWRNYQTFGRFTLSGNENIVMVYYTAAGAWQVEHGCSLEEAQAKIQQTYHLPPPRVCHNVEVYDISPREVDDQLRAHKFEILTRYPIALLRSGIMGLGKSFMAHETDSFARLTNIGTWHGASGMNVLSLRLFFLGSLLFQTFLLISATVGLILALRRGLGWTFVFFLCGCCAYFFLTMTLSGVDCCARYRLPVMPIFYILAANAWIGTRENTNFHEKTQKN